MTELRDFAERVLHGPKLADKLHEPGRCSDLRPGKGLLGAIAPARAVELAMTFGAASFPSDAAFADAGARGRALHFFANHELLALELMAVALLRFPDAPAAFRRGLAATMRDEQRHLSLYLGRMAALGVTLGEIALGGFFWRTVAQLDTPQAFVAHMSLTFEQANLDHAKHYARRFADLGDSDTADVLQQVYADEIRHVGFGVHWMGHWHPAVPLIDAHRDALVPPVSLRRARGRFFDLAGRKAAGLSSDYLDAIANIPVARGKPAVVHLYDPTIELQLGHPEGYNPDAGTAARSRDLETLPLLYAAADDIVLVRRRPCEAFLATLRRAGFPLADLAVADLDAPQINPSGLGAIAQVQPWGWTPRLAKKLGPLRRQAKLDVVPATGWPVDVYQKSRGVAVLRRVLQAGHDGLDDPETIGVVAHDLAQALDALEKFRGLGHGVVAIKAVLGTAGRGMIRIPTDEGVAAAQRAWLARILHRQRAVVVEPWRDRVCDLSLRLTITAPGEARIDGTGRFIVDARGQYLGAVVGPLTAGLPTSVVRFLHCDGKDRGWLGRVWRTVADEVARELVPSGYVGPVGVDAIVVTDAAGRLRLRPVVELNTRVNMGHVALHLAKRVAPGCVGVWRMLRRADFERQGDADWPAFAARVTHAYPVSIADEPSRIRGGVLWTNEPDRAQEALTGLAVAPTLAEAAAMLGVAVP